MTIRNYKEVRAPPCDVTFFVADVARRNRFARCSVCAAETRGAGAREQGRAEGMPRSLCYASGKGFFDASIKEFASLVDSATIYKLVGPILLKQDRMEANLAVEGRLEFIGKEM